jgi:hypothetical protein
MALWISAGATGTAGRCSTISGWPFEDIDDDELRSALG